jgi:hypothetical protein
MNNFKKDLAMLNNSINAIQKTTPTLTEPDVKCYKLIEDTANNLEELIHFQNDETRKIIVESHTNLLAELKSKNTSKIHDILSNHVVEEYEKSSKKYDRPIINLDTTLLTNVSVSSSTQNKSNKKETNHSNEKQCVLQNSIEAFNPNTDISSFEIKLEKNIYQELNSSKHSVKKNPDNIHNKSDNISKSVVKSVDMGIINSVVDSEMKSVSEKLETPILSVDNKSTDITTNSQQKYPKISELKNLAKSRNLSVSGTKSELVKRLLDSGYDFN